MKQLIDFLPLAIFFIFYQLFDIYFATMALMVATVIQLIILKILFKHIEKVHWFTLVAVLLFGGLTLFFNNDSFIMWKPSLIYLVFAAVLLFTQFTGKPILQKLLSKEISVPDTQWKIINAAWALFFIACAALNLYIAYYFSLDIWVKFKVFGFTILTIMAMVATGIYLYRYLPKDKVTTPRQSQDDTHD